MPETKAEAAAPAMQVTNRQARWRVNALPSPRSYSAKNKIKNKTTCFGTEINGLN